MKQFFLLLLLGAFTSFVQAQEITAGVIKLEVTDVKVDDPSMAMQLEPMKGSTTDIYFKNKTSLVSMDMMGGMVTMSIKSDAEKNTFDMLMNIPMAGQKIWVSDALDKTQTPEDKEKAENAKLTYDKTKTKKIAGYDCYAFAIADGEGKNVATGYIAPALKNQTNIIQGYQALQFEGAALEITVNVNDMGTMTYAAKEVSTTVDDTVFAPDTKGYTKMTMVEFQEMMKKFGGGGF
jgi:hypothetical protein